MHALYTLSFQWQGKYRDRFISNLHCYDPQKGVRVYWASFRLENRCMLYILEDEMKHVYFLTIRFCVAMWKRSSCLESFVCNGKWSKISVDQMLCVFLLTPSSSKTFNQFKIMINETKVQFHFQLNTTCCWKRNKLPEINWDTKYRNKIDRMLNFFEQMIE